TYLAHLFQVRKRSWSTCAQAAHAFRFLYHVTLGREQTAFHVPAPKQPQKLPDILSREEVWRLLRACTHPWHRLLLATTYAGGLRVSEVVALKVADLDADRMTIHISQGKGGKDRYVPLSPRLLQEWRAYWRIRPPHVWLFANRQGTRPIDMTVAQKLYTMAKLRAGITTSRAASMRCAMPSRPTCSRPAARPPSGATAPSAPPAARNGSLTTRVATATAPNANAGPPSAGSPRAAVRSCRFRTSTSSAPSRTPSIPSRTAIPASSIASS